VNEQRILVIEDDHDIANVLRMDLTDAGYVVDHADSAMNGLIKAREDHPDLILLDLGLPDFDGGDVVQRLRKNSALPIIVLTARDTVEEKVRLLGLGADDYLIKPFSIEELLARVRAHLRRVNPAVTGEVRVADLVMNLDGREIFRGGRRVELSAKEFELLELLARNPGKVFSRFEIEEKVWPEYTGGSNVVDVYIGYLRRKLEEGGERRLIHTVRGVGYVLREE